MSLFCRLSYPSSRKNRGNSTGARYAPRQRGWLSSDAIGFRIGLFVLAGLLASACSSGDVGNEPGIDSVPQIELVEAFRLGEETGPDSVLFGYVSDLAINSAGQIFVSEGQDPKIYVYSNAGAFITTIGSKGKGPGEFSYGPDITISRGDSIFTLDGQRIAVFQPGDFRLVHTVPIVTEGFEYPMDIVGVADEEVLVLFGTGLGVNPTTEDRRTVLRLLNYQGNVIRDSVVVVAANEALVLRKPGFVSVRSMPFGRTSAVHLGPDGYLYHGWTESIDITISDLYGATHDSIRYQAPVMPVTGQAVSRTLENLSEDMQKVFMQNLHDTRPAYGLFVVGDQARTWIKLTKPEGSPTAQWLIFGADRRLAASVDLPASVSLSVITSGRAYGTHVDDIGITTVVAYNIVE